MNTETEARLIDDLHKCVAKSPHRDELLALMYEQLHDDTEFCINDDLM